MEENIFKVFLQASIKRKWQIILFIFLSVLISLCISTFLFVPQYSAGCLITAIPIEFKPVDIDKIQNNLFPIIYSKIIYPKFDTNEVFNILNDESYKKKVLKNISSKTSINFLFDRDSNSINIITKSENKNYPVKINDLILENLYPHILNNREQKLVSIEGTLTEMLRLEQTSTINGALEAYQLIQKEVNFIRLINIKDYVSIKIIEKDNFSTKIYPNKLKNTMIAVGLSLILAMLMSFIIDYIRIKKEDTL